MAKKTSLSAADLSRRTDLAGKTVSQGKYNVTYDADGYATSSTNTGHASFAGTDKSVRAPSTDAATGGGGDRASYGGSVYDQQHFSDSELKNAAYLRAQAEKSGDWSGAHDYVEGIRAKYGYSGGEDGSQYNALNTKSWDSGGGYGGGSSSGGRGSGGSSSSSGGGNLTGAVEDYSDYLRQMYAAQKASALAQLKSAYESNIAAIDRAAEGVPEQYQTARNSTAGASELAKRNFAEYAAASGLNSGTGGQAELARNVTLQNNLNTIDTAQADTLADLELQRTQAEVEYNNAIAQAEADGNYQLASALYQEKVRVQNALIDATIQQRQLDLQQYQLDYQAQRDLAGDSQWQQQFNLQQQQYADSLSQNQRGALADYGSAFLQQGLMPSAEMLSAMGLTTQDAQSYIAALQTQQAAKANASGGSSGRPSGGAGGGNPTTEDYDGLYAAAYASQNPKNYIASHYKEYGIGSSSNLYEGYTEWRETERADNGQRLYTNDFSTLVNYARGVLANGRSTEYLYDALRAQGYGDAVIDQVFAALGL